MMGAEAEYVPFKPALIVTPMEQELQAQARKWCNRAEKLEAELARVKQEKVDDYLGLEGQAGKFRDALVAVAFHYHWACRREGRPKHQDVVDAIALLKRTRNRGELTYGEKVLFSKKEE